MLLLVRWMILAFTILAIPSLVPGIAVASFGTALAAAAILSILNLLVRPFLILLTLPLTLVTFGFFLLVINALIFQFAGYLVSGFHVSSFGAAFFASLLVTFVNWATSGLGGQRMVFRVGKWGGPPGRGPRPGPGSGSQTYELHRGNDGKWES
ncbi:phage holin family protein [bacterium]|nr:phage holin family protein [bacterium]